MARVAALLAAAVAAAAAVQPLPAGERNIRLSTGRGHRRDRVSNVAHLFEDPLPEDVFAPVPIHATAAAALTRKLSSSASSAAGYCQPSQPCWPSKATWAGLNNTVGGRLLALVPETLPCSLNYTGPVCQDVILPNFTNPYWRVTQPGAMQDPFWEVDWATGDACFTTARPCQQGNIPSYGVAVSSDDDVSAALPFATAHNIRVVVKSGAHDYQGRSSGSGALLLWMHAFRGYTVDTTFAACPGDTPIPVVTAHPGTSYGDLYTGLAPDYTVVGGSARTVSAAGGHLLGGGHSYISPAYGLAADNVVQLTAVLANGTQVTASACSHPDLFWGLRGGGGGSLAVVTSATHKMHPLSPTGVTGVTLIIAMVNGLASLGKMYGGFLAFTPSLVTYNPQAGPGAGVWGGYFQGEPVSSASLAKQGVDMASVRARAGYTTEQAGNDNTTASGTTLVYIGNFVFNGTLPAAQASMAPFIEWIASQPSDLYVVELNFTAYLSFNAWHDRIDDPVTGDATGTPTTLVSRMVPLSWASNSTQVDQVAVAMATMAQYGVLYGHLVAGGAVAQADPDGTLTAVGPAWRAAGWHIAMAAAWAVDANTTTYTDVFTGMASLGAYMRQTWPAPESGSYFNENDYLDDTWSTSYWGDKYPRLQGVKAAYDPNNVFNCHNCVELPAATTTATGGKPA